MKYWLPPILFVGILLFLSFGSNIYTSYGIFSLDKKLETKVFDDYDEDILLLFFGYVGCIDVCTPRMTELANIYDKINKEKSICPVFVNLTELKDTKLAQVFASTFHKDYKALEISKLELNRLKKEFKVYSAPSLSSKTDLNHTSFLFLLKKEKSEYHLKRIYIDAPFKAEIILKDIREIE